MKRMILATCIVAGLAAGVFASSNVSSVMVAATVCQDKPGKDGGAKKDPKEVKEPKSEPSPGPGKGSDGVTAPKGPRGNR